MKVIHLISGGDSGGAKTHVLSLLQNLNQTITAQMVCFRDGPFADEARAMGIPTMICGGNNVLRIRRQLTDYIRQGGYQVIRIMPLPKINLDDITTLLNKVKTVVTGLSIIK